MFDVSKLKPNPLAYCPQAKDCKQSDKTGSFYLPSELLVLILKYSSLSNLTNQSLINKQWRKASLEDTVWLQIARNLLGGQFKNWVDDSTPVKSQLKKMVKRIERLYPKELIDVFGGIQNFLKIPELKLPSRKLSLEGGIQIQEVSAPIMRGTVCINREFEIPFITLRYMNRRVSDKDYYLDYCFNKGLYEHAIKNKNDFSLLIENTKVLGYLNDIREWFLKAENHLFNWAFQTGYDTEDLLLLTMEEIKPGNFVNRLTLDNDSHYELNYLRRLVKGEPCGEIDLASREEQPLFQGKNTVYLI